MFTKQTLKIMHVGCWSHAHKLQPLHTACTHIVYTLMHGQIASDAHAENLPSTHLLPQDSWSQPA